MRSSGKQGSTRRSKRRRERKPGEAPVAPGAPSSGEEYRVGPGHPPKQYQWKPGQSGNPTGGRRKDKLADDVKALFERALNEKVKLKRGERAEIITKLEAGFKELASQFADGDHRARRDVFDYAGLLGVDLTARQGKGRHVDVITEGEFRQALLDRGIPTRWLPPVDEAGLEPPPDAPGA